MGKKKKEKQSFYKILLSAGILSFIGGVIALFFNAHYERELEKRKFQNELIKNALEIKDGGERKKHLSLLYKVGLLDSNSINEDTLFYYLNYQRGRQDAIKATGIISSINFFYLKEKRVPYDTKELLKSFPISSSFKHFSAIHYDASGAQTFDLRFPGNDAQLYTSDDLKYNFDSLKTDLKHEN